MNDTTPTDSPELGLALLAEDTSSTALVPVNGQRQHGMNIGGNTVTQATALLPEEQRIVLRAIHTSARERGLTWAQIKNETGLSDNFLYQVWTGVYRYPEKVKDKFCPKCERVVTETMGNGGCKKCGTIVQKREQPHPKAGLPIPFSKNTLEALRVWKARHDGKLQQAGDFVHISVFDEIEKTYKRAFKNKKIFFAFGEPQVGKTRAAKELSRKYNHGQTVYVDMPPGAGAQFFLRNVAKALNVNSDAGYEKLLLSICQALDPSKAILFDNMHRVFTTFPKKTVMPIMDLILYIYDATGCVMGIFATNVFADRLKQGEFFQYLKQFKKRGVYTVRLDDEPSEDDLNLIARRHGLAPATGEAKSIMLDIAHTDGLGAFCTRLADAKDLADAKQRKVTWDDFTKAHALELKRATKPSEREK